MREIVLLTKLDDGSCQLSHLNGDTIAVVTLSVYQQAKAFRGDASAQWIAWAAENSLPPKEPYVAMDWKRKCNNMAGAFSLRSYDLMRHRNPECQRQHEPFNTRDWQSAAVRMWNSGRQRWIRKMRTNWGRWAENAARNNKRRSEAKAHARRQRNG